MTQKIITPAENYRELEEWILSAAEKGPILMVHGNSLKRQEAFNRKIEDIAEKHGVRFISFTDYSPNPKYESVLKGVEVFRDNACGAVIAAGGGSAMDVAKCIKLYAAMDGNGENGAFLKQEIIPNEIPLLAMPMTAGTGSEATRYAVIYFEGNKQSVTHTSCIPGTVLFDPGCLKSLPMYQKKATMCDALCHAIESFWSVNSTEESKAYSKAAIEGVMEHMEGYLANTDEGNAGMLQASFTAGKAINITQTTAGHAMCYKITGLFGCSHGHASMLCDRVLYRDMLSSPDSCIDPRGKAYLKETLDEIGRALGCGDAESGAERLADLFDSLELEVPQANEDQFAVLRTSVNPVRLKNHPVKLDEGTIDRLYREILSNPS